MTKKMNEDKVKVPELELTYRNDRNHAFPKSIKSSKEVAGLMRLLYEQGEIELHEVMLVLYFNQANEPIGYYRHSIGGITSTVVDVRLILGVALKSLSTGLVLVHNHPSGKTTPSKSDQIITKALQKAAKLFEVAVLDHVIITKDDHYSFSDQGLMGVNSTYPISQNSTLIREDSLQKLEVKALAIELELLKI